MDPGNRKPDFDILKVDFEWVEQTDSVKLLNKALQALQAEGGYTELENAIIHKLETIAPSSKRPNNTLSPEEKQKVDEDLDSWLSGISSQDSSINTNKRQDDNIAKRRQAEEEKVKGNDYIKSSDYVQAIECYDKACALDPGNAAVYCNRALAYLKLKKYSKVIEDCDKTLKLNPEYVKAFHRRGKARMEMNNYRDAVKDFEKVLEAEPDNKTVNSDLKKCRDELKKTGGFKRIEIVEEEEEETEEPQQSEEVKVTEEPQATIKAQETQIQHEVPAKVETQVAKADSSDKTSQEKSMEEDFELILEDDSLLTSVFDTVSKMKQEGNDLYQKGKYTEGIRIYHSALDQLINLSSSSPKLTNEKAALYNNITACHLQQGDHLKVIEFSSATISLKPTDKTLLVKAYLRRALANEATGVIISAKEDMVHVKELDPSNLQASKALQRYASIFAEKRQETAFRLIENAKNAIEKAERYKEAGNNFFKKENYDAAILDFENGINLIREYYSDKIELMNHPEAVNILVQLFNNKALANLKLGCNALVIKDCEAALELEPENLKSLYRLAKAQAACCMFEEAAKNIKKVVDREPKNAVAKKELDEYIKKAIENKKKQSAETQRKRRGSVRFAEENEQINFRKEDAPEEIKVALSSSSQPKKNPQPKQNPQPKSNPQPEANPQPKQNPQPKSNPKPKPVKVSTEKVATAKSIATINVADLEKPTSAFALESVTNTLKRDPANFYTYLHRMSAFEICSLFTKTQLSSEILSLLIQSLPEDLDIPWTHSLLSDLPKSISFSMTTMFLNKSEKETLRQVISKLQLEPELQNNLLKSYKIST